MARFKVKDRVRINVTIGSIYNKAGTILRTAQMQNEARGQIYTVPNWEILLDDGRMIVINEKYLIPER